MESTSGTVIYLTEEHVYGYLVSYGAFVSRVQFTDRAGNECDCYIENNEFIELETNI